MSIDYDGEYIQIVYGWPTKSGKTHIWEVINKGSGRQLGTVRWYAQWRQYVFVPQRSCVFSVGCLEEIAGFTKRARSATTPAGRK